MQGLRLSLLKDLRKFIAGAMPGYDVDRLAVKMAEWWRNLLSEGDGKGRLRHGIEERE